MHKHHDGTNPNRRNLNHTRDAVKLNGQRWIYENGNHQIILENAWSLSLQSQERLKVNGETVHERTDAGYVILAWKTMFEDTVLLGADERSLKVQCKSGLWTTKARLMIDGKKVDWTDYLEGKWIGPIGEWPE